MELSAKLRNITETYGIDEKDAVYCELIHSGWARHEAAFYGMKLLYADKARINRFLDEHIKRRPGITKYINDLEDEDKRRQNRAEAAGMRMERQRAEDEKQEELEEEVRRDMLTDMDSDELEKEDLARFYSNVIRDKKADTKTKMDAAKGLSDLKQMKKEVTQTEDNRTHFFIPMSCHKCSLYIRHMDEKNGTARKETGTETAGKATPAEFL